MIDRPDRIVETRLYQGVNVISAEGVHNLPETPCVRPGEKSAQSEFKRGHFGNVPKTKVQEIPSRSLVQYMRVDECKEEEDE